MDSISQLAKSIGKSNKETIEVVNAILDTIRDALQAGDEVRLVDFGSFVVKTRAARTGGNPQTRAKIKVPAKQQVRFSPGKALSEAVAK